MEAIKSGNAHKYAKKSRVSKILMTLMRMIGQGVGKSLNLLRGTDVSLVFL
jgi:hypothetical protein